jgi:hypothetical protein
MPKTTKPLEHTSRMDKQQPVTKQDFDGLKDTLDRWRVKTQAMVDSHDKKLTENKEQLDQQHHALFGNGEPGMDEQIRNLTAGMSVLVRLAWIVAGSVITMTLSGIVWAAVYIIRNTK